LLVKDKCSQARGLIIRTAKFVRKGERKKKEKLRERERGGEGKR
jgi:hypothetical protein